MIIDLPRFLSEEKPHWQQLERWLDRMDKDPTYRKTLPELRDFYYLYQRTSADLAKVATFASEPGLRSYLESLVARAYSEIHETRERGTRIRPWQWFTQTFPRTFRSRVGAFYLSLALTLIGAIFGAAALAIDPDAKEVLLPFSHLKESPSQRVRQEEKTSHDRLEGRKTTFAADLMTHNIKVGVFTMALGLSWGVGTSASLFYNGVILGAVALDYVRDGQTRFLLGWLLPHGAVEIPSILLAGQAGFLLAGGLIGWGSRKSRRERLREISPDLMTLIFGFGVMLVWAGVVEAFLSQYHEPVVPYELKIGFGVVELLALTLFLSRSGR